MESVQGEGAEAKSAVKDFWAFTSDSTGRIYLGTDPAELFHSDDDGKTFRWVYEFFGIGNVVLNGIIIKICYTIIRIV